MTTDDFVITLDVDGALAVSADALVVLCRCGKPMVEDPKDPGMYECPDPRARCFG